MQPLAQATIRPGRRGSVAAVPGLDCARAVLEGVPPVMWFIRRHMRRSRARGLSVPQFRSLVLLSRYPAAGVSAVAEHLGCTLPSASRVVARLVRRGFVVRRPCQADRRRVALVLAAKGEAAMAAALAETHSQVAAELARLTAADRATVAAAMRVLRDAFSTGAGLQRDGGDENEKPRGR